MLRRIANQWVMRRRARRKNREIAAYLSRHRPPLFQLPAVTLQVPAPVGEIPDGVASAAEPVERPGDAGDLAFLPAAALADLLRRGELSVPELTELFLDRLRRHGPELYCVVSELAEAARARAAELAEELAQGRPRSPLHGLPWGVKDVFATREGPTRWGARRYLEQRFDEDAAVVSRLEAAGAVCLAKLATDRLASGSSGRWYGGVTRNPWSPEASAGGSSGGPAAAVAAGLVPFALGSETVGSTLGPAGRCGVIGLRPTFGRVSRYGMMPGVPSVDKVGIFCRHAADGALVLAQLAGADPRDPAATDAPFGWRPLELGGLRVGVDPGLLASRDAADTPEAGFLSTLESSGVELVPVSFPDLPLGGLDTLRLIEALHAQLHVRNREIDRPASAAGRRALPARNRFARSFSASDYLELCRLRGRLVALTEEMFRRAGVELYVTPFLVSVGEKGGTDIHRDNIRSNLTGLPALSLPVGLGPDGLPAGLVLTARWWREDLLLGLAHAYQRQDRFHLRRPPGFGGS